MSAMTAACRSIGIQESWHAGSLSDGITLVGSDDHSFDGHVEVVVLHVAFEVEVAVLEVEVAVVEVEVAVVEMDCSFL
jgi:hypothetical protein